MQSIPLIISSSSFEFRGWKINTSLQNTARDEQDMRCINHYEVKTIEWDFKWSL
jgi:hypothetical protein